MPNKLFKDVELRSFMVKLDYGGGVELTPCSECGAIAIWEENQKKHEKFHAKFDELVEWAQSVSKLFGGTVDNGSTES